MKKVFILTTVFLVLMGTLSRAAEAPPKFRFEGEIPCGNSEIEKLYISSYPKLVTIMGQPFTFAPEGLTFKYDTSGKTGHGWDAATNVIYYTPGDVKLFASPCDTRFSNNLINAYVREVAHLFYDIGQINFNFGPQWLRQGLVGYALNQTGIEDLYEGTKTDRYDRIAFTGWDRVNGTYSNYRHYADGQGGRGRNMTDLSATFAFKILTDILGEDLLVRINKDIYSKWKNSGVEEINPEGFAAILNSISDGKTIDGVKPGDWLIKQPVSNSRGAVGNHLSIHANFIDDGEVEIASFNRYLASDNRTSENPLPGTVVEVTVMDAYAERIAAQSVTIPSSGNTSTTLGTRQRTPNSPGVYLIKAVSGNLFDSNIYLKSFPRLQNQVVVIPLNSDGSAIQPQVVNLIKVSGATRIDTSIPGALIMQIPAKSTVELSYLDWSAKYTVVPDGRVIPVKLPNSTLPLPGKSLQPQPSSTPRPIESPSTSTGTPVQQVSPVPTPTPTPLATATPSTTATPSAKKTTITCIKGNLTKKVKSVNPKCPAGYKKK